MSDQQGPFDFETVMVPYLDDVYSLARWMMRNDADADDVAQEAIARALKYFGTFKGTNARAWMLQIVRNVAYRALRKRREGANVVPLDQDLSPNGLENRIDRSLVEPPSDAETELSRMQDLKLVDDAMTRLPVDLLECIVLYEVNGRSYKEIARITDAPIGTVMSRMWRARRKLAELVASVGQEGARVAARPA
jgi:RNA polymerase sigma factor (sigma-70 family)